MNTTSLFVTGIGGALAMLLASCAPPLDTTTRVPMSAAASPERSSLVGQLDASLNRYRQTIGKSAIPRHSGLDRLAHDHCVFMARNKGKFTLGSDLISHYGFEQRTLLAQRQFGMESVAENVAGGSIQGDVANQLVGAWTGSKKHLYNLKQDWSATGVGVYVAEDGTVYATQIFATKNHSQMALTDRFRQF